MDRDDIEKHLESAAQDVPRRRGGDEAPKQADMLIQLTADAELFHDADGIVYATFHQETARQTWRLRCKAFKNWLAFRAYSCAGFTPNTNAMNEALTVLEGKAMHAGPEIEVHRRIAEHGGKVYVDLCNDSWQAVEVDKAGWRVIDQPPVRFVRSSKSKPLPTPTRGGDIRALRRFLNVTDENGFILSVAWLVGAFRPRGPYAALRFFGAQGSAKSTATRVMRALVDPAKAPLRSAPRNEDDLIIAAQHGHVVAFDNLGTIPEWLSNALCRLATGGGLSKRELYTDSDEVVLEACCPVIINGIGEIVQRGDAQDRLIDVGLKALRDGDYEPEVDFWAAFEAARPGILGALLDAVSCALRRFDSVSGNVRMADFCKWVEAASPALGWPDGHFTKLYVETREQARRDMLSINELANALVDLVEPGPFEGTATALLNRLRAPYQNGRRPAWIPKAANTLSSEIDKLLPVLRSAEISVERPQSPDSKRTRLIRITREEKPPDLSSEPSASSISAADTSHAADGATAASSGIGQSHVAPSDDPDAPDGAEQPESAGELKEGEL